MTVALIAVLLIALYVAGNASLDEPVIQAAISRFALVTAFSVTVPACRGSRARTVQIGAPL
jgi:hypothetical protein